MNKYNWFAQYANGSMLCEFNPDGTENSFYDIDKASLQQFGLVGEGNVYLFNVLDGMLNINGNLVNIAYGRTKLTGSGDYSDIISYKDAEAVLIPTGGVHNGVTKFTIGYKAKIKNLSIKILYTIDVVSGENYVTVRLVSTKAEDKILTIGKFKVKADLVANVGGEVKVLASDVI